MTLKAVIGASIAIQSERQIACISGEKPKTVANTGSTATEPPGIPGAATQVTASISTKAMKVNKSISMPVVNINAIAHSTTWIFKPGICRLAQSGTTNDAVSSLPTIFLVCLSVIGIVAAEEDVANAKTDAGTMVQINRKGFLLTAAAAMR